MRNKQINLIDIGLDSTFNASMMFVQSVLENTNAGYPNPVIDIDFVRSRDLETVMCAFTASCDVLHVMAHGDSTEKPTFFAGDGSMSVTFEDLGAAAADRGRASRPVPSWPTAVVPGPLSGAGLFVTACRAT